MRLLDIAAETRTLRLDAIERETRKLLAELDNLEIRLHMAFEAVSIDGVVAYLDVERKRMLEHERQAKINAGLASVPALVIYGLLSLAGRQKVNWKRAVASVFREGPYEDVRIAVSGDNVMVANVSRMARERNMTVAGVVAYLEKEGNKVFSWPEFEARARNLRTAALKGEAHLGVEKAALEEISVLTARHGRTGS